MVVPLALRFTPRLPLLVGTRGILVSGVVVGFDACLFSSGVLDALVFLNEMGVSFTDLFNKIPFAFLCPDGKAC